jgi:hypothetical protein
MVNLDLRVELGTSTVSTNIRLVIPIMILCFFTYCMPILGCYDISTLSLDDINCPRVGLVVEKRVTDFMLYKPQVNFCKHLLLQYIRVLYAHIVTGDDTYCGGHLSLICHITLQNLLSPAL